MGRRNVVKGEERGGEGREQGRKGLRKGLDWWEKGGERVANGRGMGGEWVGNG